MVLIRKRPGKERVSVGSTFREEANGCEVSGSAAVKRSFQALFSLFQGKESGPAAENRVCCGVSPALTGQSGSLMAVIRVVPR